MHAPSEPIALGEDFEVNDLNLPLAAVYARPRKGSNKTSFLPLKDLGRALISDTRGPLPKSRAPIALVRLCS